LFVVTDANKLEAVNSRNDGEHYDKQNTQGGIAVALFLCPDRVGQLHSLARPRIYVQSDEGFLLFYLKERTP